MIQGDTKRFAFKIKKKDTSPTEYVDGSSFDEVEVQFNSQTTFNSVKKLKSDGDVTWDSTNSCFICDLSQEDTFTLSDGETKVQVRLLEDDDCKATLQTTIEIGEALSNEVLE